MSFELADTLTPTEDDRLLQAEALVRSYCGWHIAPSREETVTFTDGDSAVVFLPSLHVTAIESVTFDGDLVAPDDYVWSTVGTLTWRDRWGWQLPLEIEFTHGYTEAPPEVTAVVQAVASRAISNPGSLVRRQVGPFGDTYSQTGFNQSLPMALLAAEKSILDRYKLPPRP